MCTCPFPPRSPPSTLLPLGQGLTFIQSLLQRQACPRGAVTLRSITRPNSSSTARAKLPVKQTALKRDGTTESSHTVIAIPTCRGVGLTAGSGPHGQGEADHTPSSKTRPKTPFCTSLHKAGLPPLSNTVCHIHISAG